jgi:hypothetical protein
MNSFDQGEGQARAQQAYPDKRRHDSRFQPPRRRRSEVCRERQVERRDHDEQHREEDLLCFRGENFPGDEDGARRSHEPDHRIEDHDHDKSKHAVSLDSNVAGFSPGA